MTSAKINVSQLTLYNPARMKDAEIVAAFVARKAVFERLIADIAAEKPDSRAQHHLIVGQRGMGKSTLLARVAAELRTNAELSKRFVPLVFAEEQYAVDRLSKFWLNCLDSLADASERAGNISASERIDAIVQSLKPQSRGTAEKDEAPARAALDAFLKVVESGGKRPVLLVDNLQLVFERIAPIERHALRELFMQPGSPILIGASPSPPRESQDYGAAFYDHFKIHYLRSLSDDEMRGLMLSLAEITRRPDVRKKVLADPQRLKTLRDLTGGNPRTVAILFFLYAEDFSPGATSAFADLQNLLDRVTPLYKARIEELAEQQQVVVSAVADRWAPITARALSETTGLPMASISAQLDRLEKTGFVDKVEIFDQSSAGYQIAERFFNIWFLMRSASRRQHRMVGFLVRFIESFYEAKDRLRLARDLMNERRFSPDRLQFARALAQTLDSIDKDELARHLELYALRQKEAEARRKLEEVIDFSQLPPATVAFDELRESLMALVPADAGVTPEDFAEEVLGDRQMFIREEREKLVATTGKLSKEKIDAVRKSIDGTRKGDELEYGATAVSWFRQRLASGQLRNLEDSKDWDRSFLQADGKNAVRMMVDSMPVRIASDLSDEVRSQILISLAPKTNSSFITWGNWGNDLQQKLGAYPEAEFAYRKAIELAPQDAAPWNNLGNLLQEHLGRYEEAESAYRKAIEIDGRFAAPWNNLGCLLQDHLGRYVEAESAYAKGLEIDGADESARQNLVFLRRDLMGDKQSARHAFEFLQTERQCNFKDTFHLQEALFAAYDANWGLCREALGKAIEVAGERFPPTTADDWFRASAVLLHLNYGEELLTFLRERGDESRLRPWYEALSALHRGDRRYLQNIPVEVRTTAEYYFDQIDKRLNTLPEKTRRRPVPTPVKKRRKT